MPDRRTYRLTAALRLADPTGSDVTEPHRNKLSAVRHAAASLSPVDYALTLGMLALVSLGLILLYQALRGSSRQSSSS